MVRKTVDNDGWTQLLSEESDERFVTVDVDNETIYLSRSLGEPVEAETGIKARSGENTVFSTSPGEGVWARSTSSTDASVRIIPGYRKETDGRGTVNADLVGTPEVDVTDQAGRVVGKVRLEDDNNTLIKESNPLPTDVRAWNASTLPIQEDTPLDVSAATVSQTTDTSDAGPYADRVTATGTYAMISPGRHGQPVTIVADTSGTATLTIEVSVDGGANWDAFTVSIGGAEGVKKEVSGFGDVRASVDQNLNALALSAKGV